MIDLHSHILYGLDDGPKSAEESIAMAVLYKHVGFSRVVATPHFVWGTRWTSSKNEIDRRVSLLNESLENKGVGIRIFSGMEIALDADLEAFLDQEILCTLAGSPYLLIEPPFYHLPQHWDYMLFALTAKGYRIILAHPERCPSLVSDPKNLDKIKNGGILLQANCDSFLGYYGKDVSSAAFHLLTKGHLHLLATDSHDTRKRSPENMLKALPLLEAFAGPETINLLTRINPENVLNGLPLETPAPISVIPRKRKKWWFF
jgi:protein-tyrosine phosphatase